MKKILILCLFAFSFAAAQKLSVAVFPCWGNLEEKNLNRLRMTVENIGTKNLPIEKFRFIQHETLDKSIDKKKVFEACKEGGSCLMDLVKSARANYGTWCQVDKLNDGRLVFYFQLYDNEEKTNLATEVFYPKNAEDVFQIAQDSVPGIFKRIKTGESYAEQTYNIAQEGEFNSFNAFNGFNNYEEQKEEKKEEKNKRFGVVLGAGLAFFSDGHSSDRVWEVGITSVWPFTEKISLEVGVLYSEWGASSERDYLTLTSIDVPVMLRYEFNKPYIGAGMKISIPKSGEVEMHATGNTVSLSDNLNIPELSLLVGGGYTLGSFIIGAKYFLPITDVVSYDDGSGGSRGGAFLELGYLF